MQIIKPHKKLSREVKESDIPRVIEYAKGMLELCNNPLGRKKGAYAIAHCQVTDEDPLCFFVMQNSDIIINPEIIGHTKTTVDSLEGCLSFPDKKDIIVQRYNKCEARFSIIENNTLKQINSELFSGREAKIFQHEIEHFRSNYIYD